MYVMVDLVESVAGGPKAEVVPPTHCFTAGVRLHPQGSLDHLRPATRLEPLTRSNRFACATARLSRIFAEFP
jgi:hypothetical protein